jgi:hypothetical protein
MTGVMVIPVILLGRAKSASGGDAA